MQIQPLTKGQALLSTVRYSDGLTHLLLPGSGEGMYGEGSNLLAFCTQRIHEKEQLGEVKVMHRTALEVGGEITDVYIMATCQGCQKAYAKLAPIKQ